MYIHICICIYIYIHIHTCAHIAHQCPSCVCVCMCMCVYVHIYIHIRTYIYIYIYIHMFSRRGSAKQHPRHLRKVPLAEMKRVRSNQQKQMNLFIVYSILVVVDISLYYLYSTVYSIVYVIVLLMCSNKGNVGSSQRGV